MRKTSSFVLAFSIGIIGVLVSAVMIAGASPVEVKGDLNCDGSVNPIDSLLVLRHDAGLNVSLPLECDAIGSTSGGAARSSSAGDAKGDMNCDQSVNPVDSLLLLRHDAGLAVNLPPGCDAIGSTAATATPEPPLPPKPSFTAVPTATQSPATSTPTPTVAAATTSPTPPPLPQTIIGRCWLALISFQLAEPDGLSGSHSCLASSSPTYTCFFSEFSSFVDCTSSTYPSYSCYFYSFLNNAECDTFSSGYPDYDCWGYTFLNSVDCSTYASGWPNYSCYVYELLLSVSCNPTDFSLPSFVCDYQGAGSWQCY